MICRPGLIETIRVTLRNSRLLMLKQLELPLMPQVVFRQDVDLNILVLQVACDQFQQ